MKQIEMLWIDIETTGLSVREDVILEIGLAATDRWGDIVAEKSWVIHNDNAFFQKALRGMPPVVEDMHKTSGLLADMKVLGLPYEQVEDEVIAWLEENVPGDVRGKMPMAGSSVGFDRKFIEEDYPAFLDFWHPYRVIDISTIKELCKLTNPELYAKAPNQNKADAKHRALDDLHASIDEYRWYLQEFLLPEDE